MNVAHEAFVEKLGKEDETARKYFYLITLSRILLGTLSALGSGLRDAATLTRKQIATAVRKAFDDPIAPAGGGGRPRQQPGGVVRKLVVFLEEHADSSKHFHVAVYLSVQLGWSAAKRTLRIREKLAAHFSCSHDFWWSVLRYGTDFSKKDGVDDKPEIWLARGEVLDLFEESQEQHQAKTAFGRRQ